MLKYFGILLLSPVFKHVLLRQYTVYRVLSVYRVVGLSLGTIKINQDPRGRIRRKCGERKKNVF